MADKLNWQVVQVNFSEDCNVILGQSHFIKTVEDLYEALITSSPSIEFGIGFCEASGDRKIRFDGNAQDLISCAVENAKQIGCGHSFIVVMRKGFPINVLDRIKNCQEVCRVFAATANPLQVIIAETEQGRGIAGVIDGFTPLGVENETEIEDRKALLRKIIGYKR